MCNRLYRFTYKATEDSTRAGIQSRFECRSLFSFRSLHDATRHSGTVPGVQDPPCIPFTHAGYYYLQEEKRTGRMRIVVRGMAFDGAASEWCGGVFSGDFAV